MSQNLSPSSSSFFPPPALPFTQFDCDGGRLGRCWRLLLVSVCPSGTQSFFHPHLWFLASTSLLALAWYTMNSKASLQGCFYSSNFWERILASPLLDFLSVSPHLKYSQGRIPDLSNAPHVWPYLSTVLAHSLDKFHLKVASASFLLTGLSAPALPPSNFLTAKVRSLKYKPGHMTPYKRDTFLCLSAFAPTAVSAQMPFLLSIFPSQQPSRGTSNKIFLDSHNN